MKIFVIIVTYNAIRWLDKCLGSLERSNIPVQTVLIDNNSNDDTVNYVRTHFSQVHLIANDKNLGFGAANNVGIKYAMDNNADYVFLLNQDAWIEANTIEFLVDLQQNNPQYGIISPIHLNGSGTSLDRNFSICISPPRTENLLTDLYLSNIQSVYSTAFVNAAAWLVSRDCIQMTGGFDSVFFHYGEDVDFCNRVLFNKFKIGICPSVRIYHDREDRNGDVRPEFKKRMERVNLSINFLNPLNNKAELGIKNYRSQLRIKLIKSIIMGRLYQIGVIHDEFKYLNNILTVNILRKENKFKFSLD